MYETLQLCPHLVLQKVSHLVYPEFCWSPRQAWHCHVPKGQGNRSNLNWWGRQLPILSTTATREATRLNSCRKKPLSLHIDWKNSNCRTKPTPGLHQTLTELRDGPRLSSHQLRATLSRAPLMQTKRGIRCKNQTGKSDWMYPWPQFPTLMLSPGNVSRWSDGALASEHVYAHGCASKVFTIPTLID